MTYMIWPSLVGVAALSLCSPASAQVGKVARPELRAGFVKTIVTGAGNSRAHLYGGVAGVATGIILVGDSTTSGPTVNPDGSTTTTTTRQDDTSGTTYTTTTTNYVDGTSSTTTVVNYTSGRTTTQNQNRDGSSSTTTTATENGVTTTDTMGKDKDGNRTTSKTTTHADSKEKEERSTTMDKDGNVLGQMHGVTDKDGNTTTDVTDKDGNTTTTTADKDGKTTSTTTANKDGTGSGSNSKGKYRITQKDGGIWVEWDLPSGTGGGTWFPPGTEIKPNIAGEGPLPYTVTPPPRPAPPPEPATTDVTSQAQPVAPALDRPEYVTGSGAGVAKHDIVVTDTSTQKEIPGGTADYVASPGTDVAKNDIVLTDIGTQKEIPGGKVVIIPADPKQAMPPPIMLTSTGTVTLPETQPNDRIVFLPDNHKKIVIDGGDRPKDVGERIAVPEQPLRLIVHETACGQVTDSMVRQGLTDQYSVRPATSVVHDWNCADYHFGTDGFARNDSVVTVPHYVPLKPGITLTDGGPMIPKDGPTITDGGTVIEGDQPREIQGGMPTEPFASSQGSWGQAYADQWYLSAVHWLKPDKTSVLPEHGTPVTVAVIDTGVDFSHPELAAAKWVNPSPGPRGDVNGWNFVDNSADVRDFSGHGTIVAGIIAAASTEHKGIAGINPWARIMALKAMEIDGKGGSINLAQAIVYAADHGARVINMSVGGRTVTRTEQDAIDYATRRNALVVVASGNEGIETTNFSPAGLHNVLAVAAVGPDLKRQAFSNWGGTIGISAPGVDILSLRARQTDLLQMTRREYKPGTAVVAEQYYRVTGSSFAAPMVSGAASLLLSVRPELTAVQVRRMLLQSARDMEAIGTNQFNGYGVLDVEAALAANPDHYAEAAITGVAAVQSHGAVQLRVSGTADADSLKDAHLEFGPGDNPTKWTVVARPLTKPVVNGVLADLPADALRGGKQWTLRVVVLDRAGLRREARFKLTLG
jgi:Subtilase family